MKWPEIIDSSNENLHPAYKRIRRKSKITTVVAVPVFALLTFAPFPFPHYLGTAALLLLGLIVPTLWTRPERKEIAEWKKRQAEEPTLNNEETSS